MPLLPVAQAIPFNNATDGYTAIQVQAAIEEAGSGAHIDTLTVSAQTTVTTTSATPATYGSMTLTPIAAKYLVIFDSYAQSTTGGNSIVVGLYVAGTVVTGSTRTIQFPTATLIDSGYPFYIGIQGQIVTVNGSQAVEIRWSTSGGTASGFNRTLTLVEV